MWVVTRTERALVQRERGEWRGRGGGIAHRTGGKEPAAMAGTETRAVHCHSRPCSFADSKINKWCLIRAARELTA